MITFLIIDLRVGEMQTSSTCKLEYESYFPQKKE